MSGNPGAAYFHLHLIFVIQLRIFILSSVVLIWIGHLWVMSFVNQQLEVEYFMEMLLQLLKSK